MLQIIEGDRESPLLLKKCLLALETDTGDSWTPKRIRELWQLSDKTSKTVLQALLKNGALILSNGQYHLGKALENSEVK